MNLQKKLIASYLLITLMPILLITLLFYTNIRQSQLAAQQNLLEQIADSKAKQVQTFFDDFQEDMNLTKDNPAVKRDLQILASAEDNLKSPEYKQAREDLDSVSQSLIKELEIEALLVTNFKKEVVYASNQKYEKPQSIQEFFPIVGSSAIDYAKNGIYISDIFIDKKDNNFDFLVTGSLQTDNDSFNTIIFVVNAQKLYDILHEKIDSYKSGEFLIGRLVSNNSGSSGYPYDVSGNSVLYLSPLLFNPFAAFKSQISIGSSLGKPIQMAVQGNNISGFDLDYRGKQVLAIGRFLPKQKWGLITKVDVDELVLPVDTVLKAISVFSLVTLLVIIFIAWLLSRGISQPILELTDIAKKIGAGDLNVQISERLVTPKNEIGILAKTIFESASKLQDYYKDLDRKVKEQTKDLEIKINEAEAAKKAILNVMEDLNNEKDMVERSKARDEAILSNIGDGLIATDEKGTIQIINKIAQQMLGWQEREALGKSIMEILPIKDEKGNLIPYENRPLNQALQGQVVGSSLIQAYRAKRKDNTEFLIWDIASPIVLKNRVVGGVIVFRDVTKEAEVDRMKTEFISLASHQLRTPLSAIKWFTELLNDTKLDKEQTDMADNIALSTERMIELVNSLLNVSRIESGRIVINPKPTNLGNLAKDVIKELQQKIQERKISVNVNVLETLPEINIDSQLIHEVYMNLLTNAIKYTPVNGKIDMTISIKAKDVISQVSDDGIGIPKDDKNKVFTKFYRSADAIKLEPNGNGLGLYLAKAIVESSGGKIGFESKLDKGTIFWFSMPLTGSIPKKGEVSLDS